MIDQIANPQSDINSVVNAKDVSINELVAEINNRGAKILYALTLRLISLISCRCASEKEALQVNDCIFKFKSELEFPKPESREYHRKRIGDPSNTAPSVPESVSLMVNAPCMLKVNLKYQQLRKGECGIVKGVAAGHVLVKFESKADDEKISPFCYPWDKVKQIPLALDWARYESSRFWRRLLNI